MNPQSVSDHSCDKKLLVCGGTQFPGDEMLSAYRTRPTHEEGRFMGPGSSHWGDKEEVKKWKGSQLYDRGNWPNA